MQTLEMLEKKEKVLQKKIATEIEKAREYTRAKNKRGKILSHAHRQLSGLLELSFWFVDHPVLENRQRIHAEVSWLFYWFTEESLLNGLNLFTLLWLQLYRGIIWCLLENNFILMFCSKVNIKTWEVMYELKIDLGLDFWSNGSEVTIKVSLPLTCSCNSVLEEEKAIWSPGGAIG